MGGRRQKVGAMRQEAGARRKEAEGTCQQRQPPSTSLSQYWATMGGWCITCSAKHLQAPDGAGVKGGRGKEAELLGGRMFEEGYRYLNPRSSVLSSS